MITAALPIPKGINPAQIIDMVGAVLGYDPERKIQRYHTAAEKAEVMRIRAMLCGLCVKHCIHSRAEIATEMRLHGSSDINHAVKLCNKLIAEDAGFSAAFAELDRKVMDRRLGQ